MKFDWQKEFGIGKFIFTLAEIRDLVISALVLGLVFSIALKGFEFLSWTTAFNNYLIALAIIAPTLLLHEFAHKFLAQKYGCKAHYVLWPIGAILAMVITFITAGRIIFAALGAVVISTSYHTRLGYRFIGLTTHELGKISAAGPIINIVLAIVSYILMSINPIIFTIAVQINLIIAFFNCLPVPPLDGAKIFGWSKVIWAGLLATVIILWFLPPLIGLLVSIIIALIALVGIFFLIWYLAPQAPAAKEYF